MILAMAVSVCAMLTCLLTRSVAALAVALLVMGAFAATLQLARQSYVAEVMAVHHRARAMSTLGGVFRVGLFLCPFGALPVIALWGTRATFAIPVVTSTVAALILFFAPSAESDAKPPGHGPVGVAEMFAATGSCS